MTGNVIEGVEASAMSPGAIMRDYLVCSSARFDSLYGVVVAVAVVVATAALVVNDEPPELCVAFPSSCLNCPKGAWAPPPTERRLEHSCMPVSAGAMGEKHRAATRSNFRTS